MERKRRERQRGKRKGWGSERVRERVRGRRGRWYCCRYWFSPCACFLGVGREEFQARRVEVNFFPSYGVDFRILGRSGRSVEGRAGGRAACRGLPAAMGRLQGTREWTLFFPLNRLFVWGHTDWCYMFAMRLPRVAPPPPSLQIQVYVTGWLWGWIIIMVVIACNVVNTEPRKNALLIFFTLWIVCQAVQRRVKGPLYLHDWQYYSVQ